MRSLGKVFRGRTSILLCTAFVEFQFISEAYMFVTEVHSQHFCVPSVWGNLCMSNNSIGYEQQHPKATPHAFCTTHLIFSFYFYFLFNHWMWWKLKCQGWNVGVLKEYFGLMSIPVGVLSALIFMQACISGWAACCILYSRWCFAPCNRSSGGAHIGRASQFKRFKRRQEKLNR